MVGDSVCGIFTCVIEQDETSGVLIHVIGYIVNLLLEYYPGV